MDALHRPLDAGRAASDVDSRLARVNAPLVPHLASHAELVAEVRRLRGVIVTGAQNLRALTAQRDLLTAEKQGLEHQLECRNRLLDDADRDIEQLAARVLYE